MFVYEGRTSSILSANSSASAYATFNPVVSHGFSMDSRFGMGLNSLTEEWLCERGVMCRMDEITALTTTASLNHITPEEKHYLQLTALAQLGGVLEDHEFVRCETPSVVINQSGSTDLTGINWLLPVSARDCYEHFYNDTINVSTYAAPSHSYLPERIRL